MPGGVILATMNTPTDGFGSAALDALRAQAATALAAVAPAVLVHADGTLIAANPAGRAVLDPATAAALAVRLAPGLRPNRPARLERIRLAGRLTPATFACTLLASGSARAVLLVGLDIAPAGLSAEAAAAAPAHAAEPHEAPTRFTWRAGLDARLGHVDPRLAAALGRAPEEIAGLDWQALGAPGAHRAVLEGLSFSRLPVLLPTARGDALDIELGGAPIRGEGMRGFGLIKGRRAAPERPVQAPAPRPAAPPIVPPVVPPIPPRAAEPPPAPPAPPAPAAAEPTPPVRVTLSLVPSAPNVVPLRGNGENGVRASWEGLSNGERNAFREIARALGAKLEGVDEDFPPPAAPVEPAVPTTPPASPLRLRLPPSGPSRNRRRLAGPSRTGCNACSARASAPFSTGCRSAWSPSAATGCSMPTAPCWNGPATPTWRRWRPPAASPRCSARRGRATARTPAPCPSSPRRARASPSRRG